MAKEPPTVSELLKAAEVTDQEIDAPHQHPRGRGADHQHASLEAQHGTDRDAAGPSGEGMSEDPAPLRRQAAVQRMMRRPDGFARGLGLDEVAPRRIVEQIAAAMPDQDDEARLDAARQRIIVGPT